MKKTNNNKNNLSSIDGEVISQKNEFFEFIRFQGLLWLSLLILIIVLGLSLAIGRYRVPFENTFRIVFSNIFTMEANWDSIQEAVVMNLRLPRTIAAIIIGSALALSGATYQSIFKNPMVSPDLLGVSSGASVGAATAILLGQGSTMIQLSAFAG